MSATSGDGRCAEALAAVEWFSALDAVAQARVSAAAELRSLADGQVAYQAGDRSDEVFVLQRGRMSLRAIRRGDEVASTIRTVGPGACFGEEALVPGLPRRATAAAGGDAAVVAIPAPVFARARAGAAGAAGGDPDSDSDGGTLALRDPAERALRRGVVRDALAMCSLTRDLPARELASLTAAAELTRSPRGGFVYEAGDRADCCFLLIDGLVELVDDGDGDGDADNSGGDAGAASAAGVRDAQPRVSAYLSAGDLFGDEDIIAKRPRSLSALAVGPCIYVRLSGDRFRDLCDRYPALVRRARRRREGEVAHRAELVGAAAQQATRHVFQDLYRMKMARSLLVIDQDTCVRCGHCAWSCAEVHDGVSRLIRRGELLVARLAGDADCGAAAPTQVAQPAARRLLVPSSCQHCRDPACMIDCPTGAIGRGADGEVYIRESLCTGCANCAKACPWDNIHMAPRVGAAPAAPAAPAEPTASEGGGLGGERVAVKCDLCRGYQAPACVQACPTESILRLDPMRDISAVGDFFGHVSKSGQRTRRVRLGELLGPLAGALIAIAGVALAHRATLSPGAGVGLALGGLAGVLCAALAGYGLIKRNVRWWMKPRAEVSRVRRLVAAEGPRAAAGEQVGPPRSRLRRQLGWHYGLGLVALVAVLIHTRGQVPDTPAGALALAFWVTAGLGALGAGLYAWIPARLTRLERRGGLPEDLAGEAEGLRDRLYQVISGSDERLKAIAMHVLLPYARRPLGWLSLVLSGRDLAAAERQLRARIEARVPGRVFVGLDELCRVAVALRALPARRLLSGLLRAWLPLHIVSAALTVSLLLLHLLMVLL